VAVDVNFAQKTSEKENGVFDEEWFRPGMEDVNCISWASVVNELATCGVVSIDKLCDDQESSRSSGDDDEGVEWDPDQVQSFTEGHAAYGTVRLSYVHSSREHDEHNF
jgi:hypothetical protein